jgi:hypothetical protein
MALAVVLTSAAWSATAPAADPPRRKPLDPGQRTALVALLNAVDAAQQREREAGDPAAEHVSWDHHILKSQQGLGYVPFRLALDGSIGAAPTMKSVAMYIRAVSRHDGFRTAEEHSSVRDWLARGGDAPPPRQETVFIGPGEMPVGGPAASSPRRSTQAPAEALAILSLQQRALERQKAAEEAAKKMAETRERDPSRFPFEEYYFFDVKSSAIERALSLPPGEFDVYVALLDRSRPRTASPAVVRRTISVPDFSSGRLGLSSLMLVTSVNTLSAPLRSQQQIERPYAFGHAEVVPVRSASFTTNDVLSVVFQIFDYGAPDADLSIEYVFYQRADGARRLFNRTPTQELTDDDLPPVSPWETQAFTSQSVALRPFPPGDYELEVTVRDRLTRGTAKQSVAFSVR